MINAAVRPLHEREAARDAAQTLLTGRRGLLTAELAARLSSLRSDFAVAINDRCSIQDDAGMAGNTAGEEDG